jgi:hypothetical protein
MQDAILPGIFVVEKPAAASEPDLPQTKDGPQDALLEDSDGEANEADRRTHLFGYTPCELVFLEHLNMIAPSNVFNLRMGGGELELACVRKGTAIFSFARNLAHENYVRQVLLANIVCENIDGLDWGLLAPKRSRALGRALSLGGSSASTVIAFAAGSLADGETPKADDEDSPFECMEMKPKRRRRTAPSNSCGRSSGSDSSEKSRKKKKM